MRHAIVLALLPGLTACRQEEQHADLAPPAALAAGWDNYRLSEFERALKFFEHAVNASATNSGEQLQARYAVATVWNLRRPGEDRAKAEAIYRAILDANPPEDVKAWTALALARMKHLVPVGEDPDVNEVRRAYQAVIDGFPGHLAAKEAFIYKMATFVATLDPQQTRYAIACLTRYVSRKEQRAFLQPAWSLMAVGYATLKNPEMRLAAEMRSLQTTEIDPSNPFNEFAWAYWNIATIAEFDVGNFAVARLYYRRILTDYPTDIKVFGAKEALKRMDEVEAKLRAELMGSPRSQVPGPGSPDPGAKSGPGGRRPAARARAAEDSAAARGMKCWKLDIGHGTWDPGRPVS